MEENTREEHHQNESSSSIIRLSLSSSMIGERAMELRRQRRELSRIGEINAISTFLLLEKISRKVSSLSDTCQMFFLPQFNNRFA